MQALFLGLWLVVSDAVQLRKRQTNAQGPLDGFYPDEVLCSLGKDAQGLTIFFPWCIDWVKCLEEKAQPSGTPEAVLDAWGPAKCEQICGLWPADPTTTPTTTLAPTTLAPTTVPVAPTQKPQEGAAPTTTQEFRGDPGDELEPTTPPAPCKKPMCPPWVDKATCKRNDELACPNAAGPTTTAATTTTAAPTTTAATTTTEEWRGDPGDEVEPTPKPAPGKKPTCPPWVSKAECERQAKMGLEFARISQDGEALTKMMRAKTNTSKVSLLDLSQSKTKCVQSCENFKKTFSTCVSTIIFEPGKLTNMGMPKKGGNLRKKIPEVCTQEDTHCMPDLAIRYQRCKHHRTQSLLNPAYVVPDDAKDSCHFIEDDYEECKDCPQLSEDYLTQYAAFTGGCMEQMHSYRKAAQPLNAVSGIPRETGQCSISQ